jgi:hypothetical protein
VKRYNITPDTVPGNDTWAAEPRIKIDEAANGEWVRYEDALAAERRAEKIIAVVHEFRELRGPTVRAIMRRLEEEDLSLPTTSNTSCVV